MSCLWFCFKDILRADLDHVRDHWNTYYIRKSRHDTVPGRPDELSTLQRTVGLKISDVPLQNNDLMCTVQQTKKKTFSGVF